MSFIKNKYTSFYTSLEEELAKIPIKDNFIPQGCCYIEDYIIISCYDYNHEINSLLYILSTKNKQVKTIYLDEKIHCGGIDYHKNSNNIFITGHGYQNKSYINMYRLEKIIESENLSTITVDKKYEVDNDNTLYSTSAKHSSPAFLTINNNDLYVGNFINYNSTNKKKSIIKKYKILKTGDISKTSDIINNPFSNTQGLCILKNNNVEYFLFSRSFGRKRNSIINICIYDKSFKCLNTIVLPSMLEQINNYKNGIIAIFESCAKAYSKTCISYNDGIYHLNIEELLKTNNTEKDFSKGTSLYTSNKNIDIKGSNGQK